MDWHGIVYKLTNRFNSKVYVGQSVRTLDQRWWQHCSDARCGLDMRISRGIRKWGPEAFIVETIAECSDQECLDAFEGHFIGVFESCDPQKGYNDDPNPRGTGKRSAETKARISRGIKRRWAAGYPEEGRAKISAAKKGRPPPNKGKPMSEAQKQKLSMLRKNRTTQPDTGRKEG